MKETKIPARHLTEGGDLELRIHSVKELACLYFPYVDPQLASRKLRRLIAHDPLIASELHARGFRPRMRTLLPAHVRVLTTHLGFPGEL